MNHIYFGLYYPMMQVSSIMTIFSMKVRAHIMKLRNNVESDEKRKEVHSFLKTGSDYCNKQIVTLIIGITMYLPVAIILITLLRPYLFNKNAFIATLLIWFFLYWYIGHTIFFKNNRRDRYSEQFSKDSKRKNWLWALASYLIVALVWVITVILYKLINNGTQ